jgi:hypothetical protein
MQSTTRTSWLFPKAATTEASPRGNVGTMRRELLVEMHNIFMELWILEIMELGAILGQTAYV